MDRHAHDTPPPPQLDRILSLLHDALVELEVWRQHARTTEEWNALRRMALALGSAQEELGDRVRAASQSTDEAQQSLLSA